MSSIRSELVGAWLAPLSFIETDLLVHVYHFFPQMTHLEFECDRQQPLKQRILLFTTSCPVQLQAQKLGVQLNILDAFAPTRRM